MANNSQVEREGGQDVKQDLMGVDNRDGDSEENPAEKQDFGEGERPSVRST